METGRREGQGCECRLSNDELRPPLAYTSHIAKAASTTHSHHRINLLSSRSTVLSAWPSRSSSIRAMRKKKKAKLFLPRRVVQFSPQNHRAASEPGKASPRAVNVEETLV